MKRREFIKTMGVGVSAAATSRLMPGALHPPSTPNVILIMTDDQGYGDLACHGNPVLQTPNIDKLHSQSIRLTDYHVSPTCSPTRASLLTGRYCNRTGVWHTIMGRSLLRQDEKTMADIFAVNGYQTGIFGKWHLGDNYPFRPQDRGFHDVLVHAGGGIGQGIDYWGNDYFDDTYLRNGEPEKFEGYCTDIWFREAIQFIENNRNRPFFCYIPTNAAHGPFYVPEKYSRIYKEMGIKSPLAEFYGMITNIDENIGLLRKKLKTLGLTENTILIFTTDNGGEMGFVREKYNAGMRDFKASEYDGGHRVPFFMHWPGGGLTGGRDIHEISAHIDILPTLIKLCRLRKGFETTHDGISLKPLLTGTAGQWPNRVIVTDSQRVDHPIQWRKSATMIGGWRLINGKELYNIKEDPGQETDVSENHPDIVSKLRQEYENWWEDVSQRFDEYCPIIIGSDKENPTCLMSHDIHGQVVWNQRQVQRGQRCDGFWAVEIERDGTYEFVLRRWPREVDKPITETVPIHKGGPDHEKIEATDARLKISDVDVTQKILPDAKEVIFTLKLKKGKTRAQAWFINGLGDGRIHGVYYVYVTRIT